MPILNGHLDQHGHALIDVVFLPAAPRSRALQAAGQPIPAPQRIFGMIDPGATVTVIDQRVRQALNLVPFRIPRAVLPNAPAPVRVLAYKVDLFILYAGGYGYQIPSLSVFEMTLAHTGADALVGCDVLRECQFDHHGSAGTFSLAF